MGGEQVRARSVPHVRRAAPDPTPALLGHHGPEHVGPSSATPDGMCITRPHPAGLPSRSDANVLGRVDVGALQPLVDFAVTYRQAIGDLCRAVVEQVDVVAGNRWESNVGHGPKLLRTRFTPRLGIDEAHEGAEQASSAR